MNQEERLDYLVTQLCKDSLEYRNLQVEKSEQRRIVRSLMNIRMPKPISQEFLKIQDDFLIEEAKEKGVISLQDIPTVKERYKSDIEYTDKISIWQGDITRLKVDAIVNAANSQMLGCFIPCHKCIDNAIHSAAGIQLREECNEIMRRQGYMEPTGNAKITSAYNLPCKHIIHTVGPIVSYKLTNSLKRDLKNCYESCLKIAMEYDVRSIAFCCISTGEFHFPNDEAAKIAVNTVAQFLKMNVDKFDRIIFNVFKDYDFELYQRELS